MTDAPEEEEEEVEETLPPAMKVTNFMTRQFSWLRRKIARLSPTCSAV
ncbi:MAG: hypothetical protein ACLRW2_03050 [Parasutterella excrementihominis]